MSYITELLLIKCCFEIEELNKLSELMEEKVNPIKHNGFGNKSFSTELIPFAINGMETDFPDKILNCLIANEMDMTTLLISKEEDDGIFKIYKTDEELK